MFYNFNLKDFFGSVSNSFLGKRHISKTPKTIIKKVIMKNLILPMVVIVFFSFRADNTKITDEERKAAVQYLEQSRDHMLKVLDGLSNEQLNFKATPESWSIAECVEHITISENAFGGLIKMTVAEGDNPALKDSIKMNDVQLYNLIINREQKVKTSEQFEPSGKFGSHAETVAAFVKARNGHIAYIKTTQDDLRNRFNNDLPFGTVDAYQLLIFAAGHAERHVLQMEEVKKAKGYPSGMN